PKCTTTRLPLIRFFRHVCLPPPVMHTRCQVQRGKRTFCSRRTTKKALLPAGAGHLRSLLPRWSNRRRRDGLRRFPRLLVCRLVGARILRQERCPKDAVDPTRGPAVFLTGGKQHG